MYYYCYSRLDSHCFYTVLILYNDTHSHSKIPYNKCPSINTHCFMNSIQIYSILSKYFTWRSHPNNIRCCCVTKRNNHATAILQLEMVIKNESKSIKKVYLLITFLHKNKSGSNKKGRICLNIGQWKLPGRKKVAHCSFHSCLWAYT